MVVSEQVQQPMEREHPVLRVLGMSRPLGLPARDTTCDDDVAEVEWFAPDELPPWDGFAFENTVAVLKAWKEGL